MAILKNIASYAEIALWDTAIALMSSEKTRRVYSHTVASMTLRLQPIHPQVANLRLSSFFSLNTQHWIRLVFISIFGLCLGIILGWLKAL